MDEIKNIQVLF